MSSMMFKRAVIAAWFIVIMMLSGAVEWLPDVLFAIVMTVLPAVLLGTFCLVVALWQLFMLARAMVRRQWRVAITAALVLGLVPAAVLAGRMAGDAVAIAFLGEKLAWAVDCRQTVEGIDSTASAGFRMTGQMFFTVEGLAYDKTGKLPDILATPPEERPEDVQSGLPEILRCPGSARPIYGPWVKVVVSMEDCGP